MDEIQTKLIEMITAHPQCTTNRQNLKSLLADYIPSNRREINLLLSAFDEELHKKLASQQDTTLFALRSIKQLRDDYGMTEDAAFWTVESWCYLLRMNEIALAINEIKPTQTTSHSQQGVLQQQAPLPVVELGLGIYKAGVDFPSGELSLQLIGTCTLSIFYGIAKNPNRIQTNRSFKDKTYINIEAGQYLMLESFESEAQYRFRITKIS